jgi:hypothetical protein
MTHSTIATASNPIVPQTPGVIVTAQQIMMTHLGPRQVLNGLNGATGPQGPQGPKGSTGSIRATKVFKVPVFRDHEVLKVRAGSAGSVPINPGKIAYGSGSFYNF